MSYVKVVSLIVVAGAVGFAVWFYVGYYPQNVHDDLVKAGQYGDSFGMVNSLFSGFAFLIATSALIMQIWESHETGKLHKDQMELAKETARLQLLVRQDGQRQAAMTAFLKISADLRRFVRAFGEWHPERRQNIASNEAAQGDLTGRRISDNLVAYNNAFDELDSNKVVLDLLFGADASNLITLLGSFTKDVKDLAYGPNAKSCGEAVALLYNRISEAEKLMKPLWYRFNFSASGVPI